jgi:hypothetical protein
MTIRWAPLLVAICLVAMIGLVACPLASAALIPTVTTDTLTELAIQWNWSPEAPDTNTPNLVYWSATLDISVLGDQLYADCTVRHITDPHPEMGEDHGGDQTVLSIGFNTTDFGLVGEDSRQVSHDPNHFDTYRLVFDRSMASEMTHIDLTGHHVPEPSTFALLGMGAVGLLAYAWRRNR